jgi:hypothetical protein
MSFLISYIKNNPYCTSLSNYSDDLRVVIKCFNNFSSISTIGIICSSKKETSKII